MIVTHLLDISLADGEITKIEYENKNVKITYKTWNEQIIVIQFIDYITMIDHRSIGKDIEYIQTDKSDSFKQEFNNYIEEDFVTKEEIKESKKYSFISSWGTYTVLTIYAKELIVYRNIIS